MSTSAGPLLKVTDLRTEILTPRGAVPVVDGLAFEIAAGETLAIIGESGSGKSLAMLSMLGLLPSPPALVTAGRAAFEGADLLAMSEPALRRLRGNRIGMVFQEPMAALNPVLPVGDQIAETLVTHRRLGWRAARSEAVRALDRVRIPDAQARARQRPGELSGGMRQRVVIAAALACSPSLVIADEPTTALDATVEAEILELLAEMRRALGCAVIVISHDMAVVGRIADRVVVMKRGRVVEEGPADAVLNQPAADYTRTLIAAAIPPKVQNRTAVSQRTVLRVQDLVVSFPQRTGFFGTPPKRLFAVDGVSFDIAAGETLALVGESGSGKTTLARSLLGLVEPDAGRILVGGANVREASGRRRVQYIFQDPRSSLNPHFRAWQSVTEPLRLTGITDRDRLRSTAETLLEQVGLDAGYLDRLTHELSGGQRQRLGIARALCVSPEVLIADEAVSALDATTRLQVLTLLETLQRETELPILFISHDFAAVARIAHRVAVLRFGRLVEIGPTAAIMHRPQHPYTQALVAAATGGSGNAIEQPAGHRIAGKGTQPTWIPMEQISDAHYVLERSC